MTAFEIVQTILTFAMVIIALVELCYTIFKSKK